ncbi:hypothetical protein C923_00421 [Plasmodium falciparum UGT5.1]|uniref:Uncharacterized protein n=1 Tax=Plasmodium falciparum UGT5.1 TaxID=1237627 RepID=W7JUR8_PLAFA|nr:hypothetical protein C923_00421 [Plasmodium falciparum UGT5.1]
MFIICYFLSLCKKNIQIHFIIHTTNISKGHIKIYVVSKNIVNVWKSNKKNMLKHFYIFQLNNF